MSSPATSRLRMFAGPNGSGKTSLVRRLAKEYTATGLFHLHHFINADELLAALITGNGVDLNSYGLDASSDDIIDFVSASGRIPASHPFLSRVQVTESRLTAPREDCDAYVAAAMADFIRERLLDGRTSFSFETVMSHRSKVDFFARSHAAGYRTYLYFIATEAPLLNIHRIQTRTTNGGHAVLEQKVIERYQRSLQLLGDALRHASRAFLFDNSGAGPLWLAQLTPDGELQLQVPKERLPHWFRKAIGIQYGL